MTKEVLKNSNHKNNKLNRLWQFLEALPVSLPAALSVFSFVAIVLLLMGQLRNVLVWPIGIVLALAVFIFVTRAYKVKLPGSVREQRVFTVIVLAGVIIWTGWNMLYTSQNIYVYRDPGIYAVTGAELIDSQNLEMQASNVFGDNPDIRGSSSAFGSLPSDDDTIYPQGLHLLPVLLGLAGRVGGEAFMLHVNPLFGGLALLAVYGLARIFIRPRWAALATLTLGLMLPLIYFSRDTYTEPLSAALIFGSLSLIYLAQKTKNSALWLIGGFTAGAGVLVRIDALLVIASLVAFAWIYLSLAKPKEKIPILREILWFQAGLAITSLIGWLDVTQVSARYYNDLRHLVVQQLLLIVAMLVGGTVFSVLAWKTNIVSWLNKKTRNWRAEALVGGLLLGVSVLVSRPFWYTSYREGEVTPFLANLQTAGGRLIESRSYIEQTANWIWWYTGPLVALLGVIGLGMVLYYIAKGRKNYMDMLPFMIVFGVTAAVYLVRPSISPDQIWATRRFLPIVFPGLIMFAVIALQKILTLATKKGLGRGAVTVVAITIFLAGPLFISYPFLRTRTYVPLLSQVNEVCDAVPDNAAVLLVGTLSYNMTQTVRTFCKVPAENLIEPSLTALKGAVNASRSAGFTPIIMVDSAEKTVVPEHYRLTEVGGVSYVVVSSSLYHPPRSEVGENRSIYLGEITNDGRVKPLHLAE